MKKSKKKFIFFIFILIFFIIYLLNYYNINLNNLYYNCKESIKTIFLLKSTKYEIIKQDSNSNYLGIGQQKVTNKDGYFTTFTTIENHKKIYNEYKQNNNSSWSSKEYWNNTMKNTGCGITALATILSGYNKNYTPEDLRKKYYPYLNYDSIPKELSNNFNIKNSGFYYDSQHLSNSSIIEHLKTNRPILICVWNKPTSNRWTTDSHYMALLATDNNLVYLSNPNGLENDSKSSGWYNINEISPYIAKILYIESYN